ncbi:MAG: mechanosensitive ion channel [Synechococcaceae cyanobacterium RL_1_2]|nr:mechanosensitive ion channel [Synechococcaceae cyanobacterium RL_1_2]
MMLHNPYLLQSGASSFIETLSNTLGATLGPSALGFVWAILALILGWIIASIAKSTVKGILKKTDIDNKIASWLTGGSSDSNAFDVEGWIGAAVYWFILLFAVVAALQNLQLDAVSAPLNDLLSQVTSFLPKILGAGLLLGLAWLLATVSKLLITRILDRFGLDRKLKHQLGEDESPVDPAATTLQSDNGQTANGATNLSNTIADGIYWLIFLLFLPSILSTLELEGTLVPVQSLVNDVIGIIPNIFGATLIGFVGWLIAQIVQKVVTNLLAATQIDQIGQKFGMGAGDRQSLSQLLGSLVFVLVLIPTAITALDKLEISAISEPAINMLNQVLNIMPNIFTAGAVMVIAYVAGQYVAELVTNLLQGFGFDNIFVILGISKPPTPSADETPGATNTKTPSQIGGIVALVAIMLIATLTAVDILKIQALQAVIKVIMAISGQIFLGLVVFAIGLYLANFAFGLITSSGTRQSKLLGHTARISIITLVSAMALERIGIATNIVNLAFGLLVGGIAVAIAIAFGLGGREVAGEQLKSWVNSLNGEDK